MTRLGVFALLLTGAATISAQNTSGITGSLADDSGAATANAIVSATLQGGATNGNFPPTFTVKTGSDGKFAFSGLAAGTYSLCAQTSGGGLLDPCLWTTKATTVTVSAGGQAGPVSLVAARGVKITVQVNDPHGLLAATGAVDDILIGTRGSSNATPFLPANLESKGNGKTVSLLVPPGQAVNVEVISNLYQLADSQGHAFAAPSVSNTVTSPGLGNGQGNGQGNAALPATPTLVLNILGAAGKP